jgi:hypothetical protein
MSLITCPDCGNQVSTDAVACPNCGRPLAPVVVEPIPQREVIIQEVAPEKSFPPWAIALIVLLGAGLLFALFMMLRGNNDDANNRNLSVNVAQREPVNSRSTRVETGSSTTGVTVPPNTSMPSQSSQVTVPPSQTTSVTTPETRTATADNVPVDKSSLTIDAKIQGTTGAPRPVQKETFYLLDKDLESILREADIDDEEGQGLVNAFGMSVVYPDKYADTKRKALAEINKHIVAKTLTDAQGKAKFPDVKPDSYYLFGITKTREGFSVWNNPITLSEGATNLNLTPSGGR